jgi:short-subunit dehydrogenase
MRAGETGNHMPALARPKGRYHRPYFGNSLGEERLASSYYAGRVAVITGAGSGIGRALAVRLAREGALLALLDRDSPAAEATARQCQDAGARAWAHTVDVTDREALDACAAAAVAEFGRVDMLCCAAGVIHTGTVLASAWDDTARVVRVNLLGTMGTVAVFLPRVLASGGGHVVLCSSGFGLLGTARYTAYCASKFGVRGFSEALRMEMALGGHPVQVTCAYPGVVRTPIMRSGTFAAGEDAAAVADRFDAMARTDPGQAAEVILRRARQGKARAVVGADARAAALAVRVLGTGYLRAAPLAARLARRRAG